MVADRCVGPAGLGASVGCSVVCVGGTQLSGIDDRTVTPSAHGTVLSHAEPRLLECLDGLPRTGDFDIGCSLTPKEVEQQLARLSGEAGSRLSSTCSQDLGRPHPLELEPDAAQPPCQEPRR